MTNSVYYIWGRYDEALTTYQLLLEHYDNINNVRIRGALLNNMALIHGNRGEYDQAMKLYIESLEIKKKLGDQQGMAKTMFNMANIHDKKGEHDQAMKLYIESLEISKKIGDRQGIAETLNNMSTALLERQEYKESFYRASQAHEILVGLELDTPVLQRSIDILSYIKKKVGNEEFQRLTEEFRKY